MPTPVLLLTLLFAAPLVARADDLIKLFNYGIARTAS